MEFPGLMGTMSLVSGLILAFPMAFIGIEMLGYGRVVLGLAFLGVAIATLFLPEFVMRRLPRPWEVLTGRLSRSEKDR